MATGQNIISEYINILNTQTSWKSFTRRFLHDNLF